MSAQKHAEHLFELEHDEKVVLEVRRHMFVFYNQIILVVVLFFVPLFAAPFIVNMVNKTTEVSGGLFFGFFFTLWLLILWMLFFFRWTDYYLDVWVITNKRIFDIEQRGLFSRDISVFQLDHIQDITVQIDGILATLLKYGDIHIHTAGESTDFIIKTAAHPLEVKNKIMHQHAESLHKHGGGVNTHTSENL